MNNPISSIPGPDDITRVRLENGITILARANFNSPSVSVSGYLAVGSLFDPDDKLGLADFTASALMRGTASRDFMTLYDALESVGASLGFDGATHTTGFGGKALAEDLPLLLEILAETMRTPTFPGQQVMRLRAQLLTGLAIRAQDTRDMASLAFDQIVYQNHPYSRPEDGYPETVQNISRDDLVSFHENHYGPRGMVIAVVGAVAPQTAASYVEKFLGDWRNPRQTETPDLPAVNAVKEEIIRRVEIPGKSQADIVMGAVGPPRQSPEYLAAVLGNSVLGQFGLMGRIGDVVREQAGLAYYAFSSVSGGLGPGPWSVMAGVNPNHISEAVDLIRKEIRRFCTEQVTPEELSDSKSNFIGRLPLSLESNSGVANALLNLERYGLGLDYYQHFSALVSAVTEEEVLNAASKYLHPDSLAIGIAGSGVTEVLSG
jgi:zinc protease